MVLSLAPVRSARLVLPLWTAADVAAIRATRTPGPTPGPAGPDAASGGPGVRGRWHPDFPREDDVDAASLWHEDDIWGPRSIVRGVTVLGSVGFFGPPDAGATDADSPEADPTDQGEVEVGYGLVPEARGWGFATEALRALLVETDAMGVRVRASVRPENAASLRVLAKCGFTRLRGTTADGELVMVRPVGTPRAGQ